MIRITTHQLIFRLLGSLILIPGMSTLWGQTDSLRFPADTLLHDSEIPVLRKVGLLPIAAWQRLSYRAPSLNCQFYPSCSNYGAEAIEKNGILRGSLMASERIIRCNPAAYHYHVLEQREFHLPDGRLVDPVNPVFPLPESTKSPVLAVSLSAILPGAGRIYAGRTFDGILGFVTFALTTQITVSAIHNEQQIRAGIFGMITTIIYGGELYGAWRTANVYQPRHTPETGP